jgi:hypothetical protein
MSSAQLHRHGAICPARSASPSTANLRGKKRKVTFRGQRSRLSPPGGVLVLEHDGFEGFDANSHPIAIFPMNQEPVSVLRA